MSDSAVFRPHPEGPARTRLRPCAASEQGAEFVCHRFEVVSRGDFVPGLLHLAGNPDPDPAGPIRPAPLLLFQPATSTSSADHRDFVTAMVRAGLAVATIDLPLHGARSSPKLSARLFEGLSRLARPDAETDCETRILVEEFARQATSDLIRTLDALTALPQIDEARIGFLGQGIGGTVGSYLLAHDERPRITILASVAPLAGAPDFDPTRQIARSTGSSILVIESDADDPVTRDTMRALFEAAPGPRERAKLSTSPDPTLGFDREATREIERILLRELKG